MNEKGQVALFKLVAFIITVPIGFIFVTIITTNMNWGFRVPFFQNPNLLIWVCFVVMVVAFGWSLATNKEA